MRVLGLDGGKELGLSAAFCKETVSGPGPGTGPGWVPGGELGAETACTEGQRVEASSYVEHGEGPSCPSLLSSATSSSTLLSVSIAIETSACKTAYMQLWVLG